MPRLGCGRGEHSDAEGPGRLRSLRLRGTRLKGIAAEGLEHPESDHMPMQRAVTQILVTYPSSVTQRPRLAALLSSLALYL